MMSKRRLFGLSSKWMAGLMALAIILPSIMALGASQLYVHAATTKYFVMPTAAVYDYSDTNAWSLNADGSSPGTTVPTYLVDIKPSTNVVAGATLQLSVDSAAANVDFTGSPAIIFDTNGYVFAYRGDCILDSDMVVYGGFAGFLYARGATAGLTQHITTNGARINCAFGMSTLANDAAILSFEDDVFSTYYLRHGKGIINTNGHNFVCSYLDESANSVRTLNWDNSSFILNAYQGFSYTGSNLTINGDAELTLHGTAAFDGAGLTFDTVNLRGLTHTITGNNSITTLNVNPLPRVICIGDSLTAALYPVYLNDLLGFNTWSVVNKGVPGEDSTEIEARFTTDVIDNTPDYVIIWGGTNDLVAYTPAIDIEANLQTMYTAAHNAGIKVVAVTISPRDGADAPMQAIMDAVNTWILNTATDIDYKIDAFTFLEDPLNPDKLRPEWEYGGLHLLPEGYRAVAGYIDSIVPFTVPVTKVVNSTVTFTGDNTLGTMTVDLSEIASAEIIATGTTQTTGDFVRDNGTGITTITGGTWTKNVRVTIPISLDYMTISGSTATPEDIWYAGANSTDGTGNTDWLFDDPVIVVTTDAATGVTMDKDGITSGLMNATVTAIDGTGPNYYFEYGLSNLYGNQINISGVGLATLSVSIPNNLTPGATYHYRIVVENGNAGSPFLGADATFTFTMPAVTTLDPTNVSMDDGTTATLRGQVTNMGVATSAYGYFNWGYDNTYGNVVGLQTVNAIGTYTYVLTGYNPLGTVHYRFVAECDPTTTLGLDTSFEVEDTNSSAYGILYIIIPIIIAIGLAISVFFLMAKMGWVAILIASFVAVIGMMLVQALLRSLW